MSIGIVSLCQFIYLNRPQPPNNILTLWRLFQVCTHSYYRMWKTIWKTSIKVAIAINVGIFLSALILENYTLIPLAVVNCLLLSIDFLPINPKDE